MENVWLELPVAASALAVTWAVWLTVSVVRLRRLVTQAVAGGPMVGAGPPTRPLRLTAPGARWLASATVGLSLLGACSRATDDAGPTLTQLIPTTGTLTPTTPATAQTPATTLAPTTTALLEPQDTSARDTETQNATPRGSTTALVEPYDLAPTEHSATHHVVEPGENLWMIAADLLANRHNRRPTEAEAAVYWLELIELNRERLISGDVDLIHPGERLAIPAQPSASGPADPGINQE